MEARHEALLDDLLSTAWAVIASGDGSIGGMGTKPKERDGPND